MKMKKGSDKGSMNCHLGSQPRFSSLRLHTLYQDSTIDTLISLRSEGGIRVEASSQLEDIPIDVLIISTISRSRTRLARML